MSSEPGASVTRKASGSYPLDNRADGPILAYCAGRDHSGLGRTGKYTMADLFGHSMIEAGRVSGLIDRVRDSRSLSIGMER